MFRPKILHIVPSLDESYGGPAFSVPSLAAATRGAGCDVEFISVAPHGRATQNRLLSQFEGAVFEATPCSVLSVGSYSRETAPLLHERVAHGVSLIHLHSLWNHTAWEAFRIARKASLPLLLSPRSELYPASLAKSRRKKLIARWLYGARLLSEAAGFHATSEAEAVSLRNLSGTRPILVSPNGLDMSIGESLTSPVEARRVLNLPEGRAFILFLSRIHRRKNPEMLVQAAIRAGVFDRNFDIIMAGGVDDEGLVGRIQASLSSAGLASRVHWTGQLDWDRKRAAFSVSSLFVLPSVFENFGNAIAEALACCLPVITTDGTPWGSIREEGAGWIIPAELDRLTAAISHATHIPPDQLRAMGAIGHTIAQRYTWERAGVDMATFYGTLLA